MGTTADMLLRIAECLLLPRGGQSTAAGTPTTLVDINNDEPDELYNGGTLWFLTGALAGKTTMVMWDRPTFTFTFPDQGVAPGAGSQYVVLDARYPRDQLVSALNQALEELGPFDAKNEALVVIADQFEYALPAGVTGVKRLQYSLQTVAPFTWSPPDYWWEERNGTLFLSSNHPWDPGCAMRIWYEAAHARVYADTDVVTTAVHPQRIAWLAAWNAVRSRLARGETSDAQSAELEKKCQQQALALQREHPIHRMLKDPHWIDLP